MRWRAKCRPEGQRRPVRPGRRLHRAHRRAAGEPALSPLDAVDGETWCAYVLKVSTESGCASLTAARPPTGTRGGADHGFTDEPGTPGVHRLLQRGRAPPRSKPPGRRALRAHPLLRGRASEFTDLAERTKDDYRKHIAAIEKEFGDLPLAALDDRRTRGVFKDWRDKLAKKSRRQADYWLGRARPGALGGQGPRQDRHQPLREGRPALRRLQARCGVDLRGRGAVYLAVAPAHLYLPLLLGAWTGQREGDLLRLPMDGLRRQARQAAAVQDRCARRSSPSSARSRRRSTPRSKEKRDSVLILNNSRGQAVDRGRLPVLVLQAA